LKPLVNAKHHQAYVDNCSFFHGKLADEAIMKNKTKKKRK